MLLVGFDRRAKLGKLGTKHVIGVADLPFEMCLVAHIVHGGLVAEHILSYNLMISYVVLSMM